MKTATGWWVVAVVALANAGIAWYALRDGAGEPVPVASGTVIPPDPDPAFVPEPGTAGPIRYPVEAIVTEAPDPDPGEPLSLDQSDAAVSRSLGALFGSRPDRLLLRDFIRNVVVTVDNLPRERVARRLAPLEGANGSLLVTGRGDQRVISEQNHSRYTPYVILAESVDLDYMVALYVRFYPLFQQAFEELGYPEGYFNDRLVAVIDHLLATPSREGPIRVIQPKVLYLFADLELEKLSAGQKFMIRMGPSNAARVKLRLRELRHRVAGAAVNP